jgi:polysaccharide biosynthesis transport protein
MNVHPDGLGRPEFRTVSQYPSAPQPPPEFSYKDLFRFLLRRARVILTLGLITGVAALGSSLMQPAQYTAKALLMISAPQSRIGDIDQTVNNPIPDSGFIDSQIEILRSRRLAGLVVDKLNLEGDPAWNAALRQPGLLQTVKRSVQSFIAFMPPKKSALPNAGAPSAAREGVIRAVQDSISAKRRGLTYVIEVAATTRDPQQAARLANGVLDAYFQNDLLMRFSAAQKSSEWLSQRIGDLRTQVEQKESAVEVYRAKYGLLTSSGTLLTEQQVSGLQGMVMTARADLAEKEARYRQLQKLQSTGGDVDSMSGALVSSTISELRTRAAEIDGRQADLERKYGEKHPALDAVRTERARIEEQIRQEVARIARNLEGEVEVARSRLASLQGTTNSVEGRLAANNEGGVKLRELERDAAATRVMYENFLKRAQEISEAQTMTDTDAKVVSEAATPDSPSSPNLPQAAFIALLVAGVLGVAAGLMIEMFDEGLEGLEDTARETGKPWIGSLQNIRRSAIERLPSQDRHPAGYLLAKPLSAFAEDVRQLRASLLLSDSESQPKVIAVTSALAGEGKTTVAFCLARACAMAGQRVVVLDCDLRRRSFNSLFHIEASCGIIHVLSRRANWRDVIQKDKLAGVHLLPAEATGFTANDVFGSAQMRNLLSDLGGAYDVIILDCPPVLAVAEARLVAREADKTVVVARWTKTPRRSVRIAVEQLTSAGADVAGVALNCVNPQALGRGESASPGYQNASKFGYYAA